VVVGIGPVIVRIAIISGDKEYIKETVHLTCVRLDDCCPLIATYKEKEIEKKGRDNYNRCSRFGGTLLVGKDFFHVSMFNGYYFVQMFKHIKGTKVQIYLNHIKSK
jgi:hypothetical protein